MYFYYKFFKDDEEGYWPSVPDEEPKARENVTEQGSQINDQNSLDNLRDKNQNEFSQN